MANVKDQPIRFYELFLKFFTIFLIRHFLRKVFDGDRYYNLTSFYCVYEKIVKHDPYRPKNVAFIQNQRVAIFDSDCKKFNENDFLIQLLIAGKVFPNYKLQVIKKNPF